MKSAILLVVFATVVLSQSCSSNTDVTKEFVDWMGQFGMAYSNEAVFTRLANFRSTLNTICAHNAGNHSYTMGLNQFSAMTVEEFESTNLGKLPTRGAARTPIDVAEPAVRDSNDVDWRTKGIVGPVKNQGQCGSCWAFSAVASVEGFWAQTTGKLLSFSEQQVVDCCRGASCGGSMGCNGGEETDALRWIAANGGLCESSAYPYTGRDGTCKTTCTKVGKINGVKEVIGEPALITASDLTVVTVAVCASGAQWQSYKSGVMDFACGKQLNHAILLVGYAPTYYIVRNSWGTSWGIGGYVHMVRGKNLCGIANEPSYSV
jgi:hypothetical protein